MADKVFLDVNFVNADPDLAILQCWKEMVSKGFECSLMMKHSKGSVTTILESTSSRIQEPRTSSEYRDTNAQNDDATENSSQNGIKCNVCQKKFPDFLEFKKHTRYLPNSTDARSCLPQNNISMYGYSPIQGKRF